MSCFSYEKNFVKAFHSDNPSFLTPTLLANILFKYTVLEFSYDDDPCPDYGGSVDGWTNIIFFIGQTKIGTSDNKSLFCKNGDGLQLLCQNNGKTKCALACHSFYLSFISTIRDLLYSYKIFEPGIVHLIFSFV
jgi:hypothetical protein